MIQIITQTNATDVLCGANGNSMEVRRSKESFTETTEVVLPNDTNPLGFLLGGRLLQWMDRVSVISAQSHAGSVAVTAGVDQVAFNTGIQVGEFVNLKAWVTRAFHTSMEVRVEAWRQPLKEDPYRINLAYFTYVALDSANQPLHIPSIYPETPEEQKEYEDARQRREHRLAACQKFDNGKLPVWP